MVMLENADEAYSRDVTLEVNSTNLPLELRNKITHVYDPSDKGTSMLMMSA